ncbi:MAG: replication protein [Candidatus Omnitrophota bacterium]
MANPQKENGFTAIANELMEALARIRIPGEARQIVDTVIRRTYGYQKRFAVITLQEFCEATKLNKPAVVRAINKAILMNLIVIKKDNAGNKLYVFNKNYEIWKPLSKKITTLSKKITENSARAAG